jgi:hypothetical protein
MVVSIIPTISTEKPNGFVKYNGKYLIIIKKRK